MGVDCAHYILVGVSVDKDDFTEEELEKLYDTYSDNVHKSYVHSHEGLTAIVDGMSGEYILIGEVIRKAQEHDGIDLFGWKMDDVLGCDQFAIRERVVNNLISQFPNHFNVEEVVNKIKLWVLTHYT